jgi:hypothetical protein
MKINCLVSLSLGLTRAATMERGLRAVLRIHDILVWIRIRIRGSMPLTNGSGSFYFITDLKMPIKADLKKQFFCILLFEGTFPFFSR